MAEKEIVLKSTEEIYPLDAPGMPFAGDDFVRLANALGDESGIIKSQEKVDGKKKTVRRLKIGSWLQELYAQALRDPTFSLPIALKPGVIKSVPFVPGHLWGQGIDAYEKGELSVVDGPRPADVMVLGKMPGRQEEQDGRCLVGESGQLLIQALQALHVKGFGQWYITNLIRFRPPDGSTTLRKAWINDCLPLLHQELRLVRPKYILCLGADASKALLGTKFNVAHMDGRVIEYKYPLHRSPDEPENWHTALVMTVVHPAQVVRAPDTRRTLDRGLSRFNLLINGNRFDQAETDIDHRTIRTLEELQDLLREIRSDPEKLDKWIGLDAEWHGEHPVNTGSYIRTVQLAWRPKHAACIVWCAAGGAPAFVDELGEDARERGVALLNDFLRDKRVCGHFLVADLEWLDSIGLTMARERFRVQLYDKAFNAFSAADQKALAAHGFKAGDIVPAFARTIVEGGWDTGLAAHAVEETAQLGLESLAIRYTPCPRYDIPLENWKVQYCKEHGIKLKHLEGYGDCPDEVIIPYGVYDPDVCIRLMYEQMSLVDKDYEGNCCREPFWESMLVTMPILEMHEEGILVDKPRIDHLTRIFMTAKGAQEEKIQKWAQWPDFNIRSPQQVREFLFGEQFNGKKDKQGRITRIRPPEGKTLSLPPVLDTGKPPRPWSEVKEQGLENERTAGTNKTILGVLANDHPEQFVEVQWIRDFRFLDQVLKSVLRPPKTDAQGNILYAEDEDGTYAVGNAYAAPVDDIGAAIGQLTYAQNNTGSMLYDAGLASVICDDGRVRTHLYPTAESGRMKSARPPLQNMCFDGQTELLTSRGWVMSPLLRPADRVAQYWAESGKIDFVKPSAYVVKQHSGEMCRMLNKQIDMLVTPNHRCLLRRRKRSGGTTLELPAAAWGGDYQHLHAGVFKGGTKSLSAQMVILLSALQADGSYNKHGTILFKNFTKRRKWERVESALKSLGVKYSRYARINKTETVAKGSGRKKCVGFYVRAADPINKKVRAIMPNKRFGPWLLGYNRATLDLFAQEVLFWDGLWTRKSEYSSSEKENADWVQILWSLSGRRARMREYRSSNKNTRLHYRVNIRPGRPVDYSVSAKAKMSRVAWDDKVYCVTVPSTFVVTRRNGKVSVTGNSKRRDDDYKRMLGAVRNEKGKWIGGEYNHTLRSVLKAEPGQILIEADYKSAELFGMAIMAGDPLLLEHCRRNQLDESDPDYYDIHSNIAVTAFGLRCQPTKKGLESIGKPGLRVAAKNVIFGCAYGRGAKAIALQCREEGNPISVEDAQRIIDAIFAMYPGLVAFFMACRSRVHNERWLSNCFGRLRRFPFTTDRMLLGEFERQAMNFPIQSMIASAVDRALAYLKDYRDNVLRDQNCFRFKLQIHDAVLLSAPYEKAEFVASHVLPLNMSERVAIWPTDLSGRPTGGGPYHLGIDVTMYEHWGEKLKRDFCEKHGLPLKYAA